MRSDRKTIEQIVKTYKKYADRNFVPSSKLSRKQIVNAEEEFALEVSDEEIVALLDTTMFSNGKKGFLITEKKLYSSEFPLDPIELSKITKAKGTADILEIYYSDGNVETYHIKKYGTEVASLLLAICKANLLSKMDSLSQEEDALGKDIEKAQKEANAQFIQIKSSSYAKEKPAAEKATAKKTPAKDTTVKETVVKKTVVTETSVTKPVVKETPDEMNNRAHVLYRKGMVKDAFELFLKAAEGGCNYAEYTCGEMYYDGEGTAKDLEKAAVWFKKAAEKGHVSAMYDYGMMILNKEVTDNNGDHGQYWIEKAAEK
ncbi:MAG: SEL1-like repeat protein, partial [Lachnospiraceae bacterium]|nr:SEL1-like repeat protein [Lachnospiraceae bacterium]